MPKREPEETKPPPFTVTAPPDLEANHAEALRIENWRTETDAHEEEDEAAEVMAERVDAGQHPDDDETPELTGTEATAEEASAGDAGNGGSVYGADFTGVRVKPLLEDEPNNPTDILPDEIENHPEAAPPGPSDEDEVTARPSEPKPLDPSHWP